MLTYVINTSENKTFDSDQLFKLVGYNKICWMNYALDEMEKCAEEICERQTILGADDFRIAILIDFYGYDRVRNFYGTDGYSPIETGVDLSLYFPYIEAYIVDHLFSYIRKKELVIKERHIFYIQNGKHDGFNVVSNEIKQLEYVLEPEEDSLTEVISVKVPKEDIEKQIKEKEEQASLGKTVTAKERELLMQKYEEQKRALDDIKDDKDLRDIQEKVLLELQAQVDALEKEELSKKKKETVFINVPQKRYSKFRLHCTETLSLYFQMSDYPYTNMQGLSFEEFYRAFKQRESQHYGIKRHHYYASFGSGIAKAAFDNLSLSLYLIKMYEREEQIKENDEVIIGRIDPEHLKTMLITSWNKICSARTIAINNSSQYYDIKYFAEDKEESKEVKQKETKHEFQVEARKEAKNMSPEDLYNEILNISSESTDKLSENDKKELDGLMKTYLAIRDDTKESLDEYEFTSTKENCPKSTQCPSKNDYENVIAKKKAEIAEVLKSTMNVEYQNKDFTKQKEEACQAFGDYTLAKRSLGSSLFGDIVIWLLAMIIMLVPFMAISGFSFTSVTLLTITACVLTGVFLLAFTIRVLPLVAKLKSAKKKLKSCYIECRKQQKEALIDYKYRYEIELVKIEHLRYEIRNITRLYNYNLAKNRNIEQHRQMLEVVENKLSAMLNNLGVEPVIVKYKDLSNEFDVNKSYMANDNRIYKIFSIETIENLFSSNKER